MASNSDIPKVGEIIKPSVTSEQCKQIGEKLFGINIREIKELPGYEDRNFLIKCQHSCTDKKLIQIRHEESYVLKVANIYDSRNSSKLEKQNEIMFKLHEIGMLVQHPILSKNGNLIEFYEFYTEIDTDGTFQNRQHAVRLLSYIPGIPIWKTTPTLALFKEIGKHMAMVDIQLTKICIIPSLSVGIWDLRNLKKIEPFLDCISDQSRRHMITDSFEEFENYIHLNESQLQKGIIHGDPNENNILVDFDSNGEMHFTGILDWQDCHQSYLVYNLAILLSYMLQCCKYSITESISHDLEANTDENSLMKVKQVGQTIVSSYTSQLALKQSEMTLLPTLVKARLAQSLCIGEYTLHNISPDDPYLTESMATKWFLLKLLTSTPNTIFVQAWSVDQGGKFCFHDN